LPKHRKKLRRRYLIPSNQKWFMRQLLCSVAIVIGLFAAPTYGQLILAQPGQVVAGKTLLSASQPDLAFNDVVFVGEFDEEPEKDVVDLRQGVFMLDVNTGASKLLARTGEAAVDGSPVIEISSPKINGFGEVLYRVATENGSAVLNEAGAVVAQQGTEIMPGVVLGDVKSITLNLGNKWVVDDKAIYDLSGNSKVKSVPFDVGGETITAPRLVDLSNFLGAVFTNGDSVYSWVPPGTLGKVQAGPGDVIDGQQITRAVSMSFSSSAGSAILAALPDGKLALFENDALVLKEGDLFGTKIISHIGPEISLTEVGRLVFSAAIDGKQSILMVPEPTTMALALVAIAMTSALMLRQRAIVKSCGWELLVRRRLGV